jgi:hypothetical protein
LQYPFAQAIWDWLSFIININIDLSDFASVFSICNRTWSSQMPFWLYSFTPFGLFGVVATQANLTIRISIGSQPLT